jgi:hypothetical protein
MRSMFFSKFPCCTQLRSNHVGPVSDRVQAKSRMAISRTSRQSGCHCDRQPCVGMIRQGFDPGAWRMNLAAPAPRYPRLSFYGPTSVADNAVLMTETPFFGIARPDGASKKRKSGSPMSAYDLLQNDP